MKRIAAVGLVVALAGCSTVDSKDIRTSGITANYVVTLPEADDVAKVSASYRVGKLTFVELGDGESVTSSGGGKDIELERHRAAGATEYGGQLDGVVDAGTEIKFDLSRGKADDSAPRSTVKLPERVRLTAPLAGTTYSRRTSIPVRVATEPSELPSCPHLERRVHPDRQPGAGGWPYVCQHPRRLDPADHGYPDTRRQADHNLPGRPHPDPTHRRHPGQGLQRRQDHRGEPIRTPDHLRTVN